MASMATTLCWSLTSTAASGVLTSNPIDISRANAMAFHLTSIAGTSANVTFTYSLGMSSDGLFVTPLSPVTIKANAAAADVFDFAPEAAAYIKIIATNVNGTNAVTISGVLAVQEL